MKRARQSRELTRMNKRPDRDRSPVAAVAMAKCCSESVTTTAEFEDAATGDRPRSGQSSDPWIEPERYELHAAPIYRFEVDRREFFKALGCGVVVLCFVEVALAQESGRRGQEIGRAHV